MRRFYLVCIPMALVIIIAPLCFAENFEVFGTLTIKPDKCAELPDLTKTSWSGTSDIVSGTGYHFDQLFAISITSQDEHLFTGLITESSYPENSGKWIPVPFYGVFISCYQIRMATGQAVIVANLNEAADSISGYVFSTDPLGESPSTQPFPAMHTFKIELDPAGL